MFMINIILMDTIIQQYFVEIKSRFKSSWWYFNIFSIFAFQAEKLCQKGKILH